MNDTVRASFVQDDNYSTYSNYGRYNNTINTGSGNDYVKLYNDKDNIVDMGDGDGDKLFTIYKEGGWTSISNCEDKRINRYTKITFNDDLKTDG